jgi:hypothetical protein
MIKSDAQKYRLRFYAGFIVTKILKTLNFANGKSQEAPG